MMIQTLRRITGALAMAAMLATPVAAAPSMDAETETKLKTLLTGPQRSDANKARDHYRRPYETLLFFGLRQDMTVVELNPGKAGWWKEFLEPLMKDKGKYVGANLNPDGPTPVAAGTADMVLTFRNLHNWMMGGKEKQAIKLMYDSLKPGGYLGIEEHRGDPKVAQDPMARTGYVREDYAIKLFEDAGFKLVAKSDLNMNPKDTKDYPKGVWTLPPNYAAGDHAIYKAIGESDRFTMLFQKPAK